MAIDPNAKKTGTQEKSLSVRSSKRSVSFASGDDASGNTATSSKTISTTHPQFRRLVRAQGVLDMGASIDPVNLKDLQSELDQARDIELPTLEEYNYYVLKHKGATNEATVIDQCKKILIDYGPDYPRMVNQALSGFPRDAGFNKGLSPAQPDIIEGLSYEKYSPFPVMEVLDAAVPFEAPFLNISVTLPQLCGEFKGRNGDLELARYQAAYDGAYMVYGRNEARTYLKTPDPFRHAYVQTFTFNGDKLETFAHYASVSRKKFNYHQISTSISYLTRSYEEFELGHRRLRNMQDLSKRYSMKLRDELVAKWNADAPEEDDLNVSAILGSTMLTQAVDTSVLC